MTPLALATVCTRQQRPLARALAAAVPGELLVVVADAPAGDDDGAISGAELVGAAFARLAAAYDAPRLALAVVPWALERLGATGAVLSPDARPPLPLALDGDGLLVVPAAGDDERVASDRLFAASGPAARAPLEWWRERVLALEAPARPADALLARFEAVRLARGIELGDAPADDDEPAPGAPLPDGTPMSELLRGLFAQGDRDGALTQSVFEPDGFDAFRAWLTEPSPIERHNGVSRFSGEVWERSGELQRAYPDLRDDEQRRGFLGWVLVHGAEQLPAPDWVLPPREQTGQRDAAAPAHTPPIAVNLAGYVQSELGVGEIARRTIGALDAAQVPLLPVAPVLAPSSRRGHEEGVAGPEAAAFPFNLVCVNADGLPDFAREVGPAFFAGRHTIGIWWWELPTFPERFRGAFAHVDELWVGSRYVHDAIAPVAPVPVLTMPVAVAPPHVTPLSRAQLGLPEGFLALFVFDFHSVLERKNPIGAIEAFTRAFGEDDTATLVLKGVNGDLHPRDRERLRAAVEPHVNVVLREDYVSAAERDAMLAAADVYLSLHRSEGLGLTIAEAIALGVPTVATDWSGSTELLDADGGWPIACELIDVGAGHAPYDADARWADPDLDAAAAALRAIRADPAAARARAARGRERLLRDNSPAAVGAAMRARLQALHPQVVAAQAAATPGAVREARALLHAAASPGVPDGMPLAPRLRATARAAAVRAARPASRTDAVIDAVEHVADALSAEMQSLRDAHAGLTAAALARTRRLDLRVAELERDAVARERRADEPGI